MNTLPARANVATSSCRATARIGNLLAASILILAGVVPLSTADTAIAQASPTATEFPLSDYVGQANSITTGPDGNLWFADYSGYGNTLNYIGKITPSGTTAEYEIGSGYYYVEDITSGPDDSLWFTYHDGRGDATMQDYVGETATSGASTLHALPTNLYATGSIAAGADGNLWLTTENENTGSYGISRMTPAGTVTTFAVSSNGVAGASSLAAGPDGNLWFTAAGGMPTVSFIGRMTTNGKLTQYPLPSSDNVPQNITSGPDGNLWFNEAANQSNPSKIERITPSGTIAGFPLSAADTFSAPSTLATGSDGNLWFFSEDSSGNGYLGQITPTGAITEFPMPAAVDYPIAMGSGPDGNLWLTDNRGTGGTGEIVRVGIPGAKIVPKPTSGLSYVALGDSYSSGEGAPDPNYLPDTDTSNNLCHRSQAAYPNLVHEATQEAYPNFAFVACSGTTIQDFYGPNQQGNQGEQAQLLNLGSDVGQITLTLGGNNIGFADVMAYCAQRSIIRPTCEAKYAKTVNAAITVISSTNLRDQNTLPSLYKAIKLDAPNAKVFIVGYPRIFPEHPPLTCWTGDGSYVFQRSDMLWLNNEAKKLDGAIKKAAGKEGFTYVDAYNALNGHEICTADSYVNRAVVDTTSPDVVKLKKWSFHPNVSGQQALASTVESYIKLP